MSIDYEDMVSIDDLTEAAMVQNTCNRYNKDCISVVVVIITYHYMQFDYMARIHLDWRGIGSNESLERN